MATKNAQLTTSRAHHDENHSPVQTWLSLAKLLLSSASLRFTKQSHVNRAKGKFKTSQTRPPGLAKTTAIRNNA